MSNADRVFDYRTRVRLARKVFVLCCVPAIIGLVGMFNFGFSWLGVLMVLVTVVALVPVERWRRRLWREYRGPAGR